MLPFTYALDDGRIAEVLHTTRPRPTSPTPAAPLDPEITRADRSHRRRCARAPHRHTDAASALIERSDLIVAHNARFDRPFFETVLPAAHDVPWACSMREVPWTAHGFPSAALHCLACTYGVFAQRRHRALADCEVGVWLLSLSRRLPGSGRRVMAALRESAAQGDHSALGHPRPNHHQGRAPRARLSLDAGGAPRHRPRVVDRARPRAGERGVPLALRERLPLEGAAAHPPTPRHRP